MSDRTENEIAKAITATLVKLAKEKVKDGDNKLRTRASIVAGLIWERALGYKAIDPHSGKEKYHPPATWAIHLILERMEGKVGPSDDGKSKGTPIGDKISKMRTDTLNRLAENIVSK